MADRSKDALRARLESLSPEGRKKLLEQLKAKQEERAQPAQAARRPRGPMPLSHAQERLWFLDRLMPGSAQYNIWGAVRLRGDLREDVLRRAFDEIVRRHEILRTRFEETPDGPRQKAHPEVALQVPVRDLTGVPPSEREEEVHQVAATAAREPFDLAQAPLLRLELLRLSPKEHVLVVVMHHIVSDGWSIDVMIRELGMLYGAYLEGSSSPLPPLPLQYADYAVWQRSWLEGPELAQQLAHWKEHLRDAPPVLELPTDRTRPPVRSDIGSRRRFPVPAELAASVRSLAAQEGGTAFMVTLAAWAVLLSKHARTRDVVVGTPIAGRKRREHEELIGLFVNTLAVRTDLSGDPTFRELLGRVREKLLGAYQHQDLPFEKLVEELRPGRDMSLTPIFQVLFSMNDAVPAMELPDLTIEPVEVDAGVAQLDLALTLTDEGEGGFSGELTYAVALFDSASAARFGEHYLRVLRRVCEEPDLRLSELELVTDDERERVLRSWNATEATYPSESRVHELFEAQVDRTPDATAVSFEGEALTYRELDAQANALAHALRNLGVGPEARVGLVLERSLGMVVGLLGVLKAGGAYVPIDPDHPAERIRYVLEDASVVAVVTQGRLRAPEWDAQQKCVDVDEVRRQGRPDRPAVGGGPDQLMYVLYTSGSTGRPKGVELAHRGLCNRLSWMQGEYGLREDDVVLQKTPYTFDVSGWEFYWPLITGARLEVLAPEAHRDPELVSRAIVERGVTTLHFVPSMLGSYLSLPEAAGAGRLRRVLCSGEALRPDLVEGFLQRFPGVELHNLYGPTEASIDVSAWPCDGLDGVVPIGCPVWNTRLYVLDERLRPLPVGVPGELFIGGVQLARGYLGRAALTAETFVPDPYGEAGGRLYRTGDLARWRPDGVLEFLGRVDHQVKVRGYRIELGEIESVLAEHAEVTDVVVVTRKGPSEEVQLVAYVVGPAEGESIVRELRAHLKSRLPDYMVPAAFVVLEELPLTSSGKVDRRSLPEPEVVSGRAYVAPRTETERELAAMWSELLGVERVGVEDDFFDLGGHSLLATRVAALIRERMGVELPMRTIFQHPTIAELSVEIAVRMAEDSMDAEAALAALEALAEEDP